VAALQSRTPVRWSRSYRDRLSPCPGTSYAIFPRRCFGHAVGHVVLVDFVGLAAVEQLIDGRLAGSGRSVDEDERNRWLVWAEEAFADIYACSAAALPMWRRSGTSCSSPNTTIY
jgi:hypothetical protein